MSVDECMTPCYYQTLAISQQKMPLIRIPSTMVTELGSTLIQTISIRPFACILNLQPHERICLFATRLYTFRNISDNATPISSTSTRISRLLRYLQLLDKYIKCRPLLVNKLLRGFQLLNKNLKKCYNIIPI